MPLDPATLHDLDVLSASTARGRTLLSLVDRTRSRAGREALRARLVDPCAATDDILAMQQAQQALAADTVHYRMLFDAAALDDVEKYLRSTWQLPSAQSGVALADTGVWKPRWYDDYVRDVDAGRERIAALLDAAGTLAARSAASTSHVLRAHADELLAALSDARALRLRELCARGSASGRRAFDELAREEARSLIESIIVHVGALEALWSLGGAAADHGWVYPRPAAAWCVTGLYHPFLGRDAVTNDLTLDADTRVVFVTGPNMAGKSTFLKAAGLAWLLAHCGCGVPAAAMDFPVVATIFSSVHIADSLTAGESFYLAEVRRIRALATALHTHGSVCAVVDEPFRGTNVHDASEATLAIITRLAQHPRALVLIASHLAEVVPAIADSPHVRLVHFAADVSGPSPVFDYTLQQGFSTQRLGMVLLKQEGVLDLLAREPSRD